MGGSVNSPDERQPSLLAEPQLIELGRSYDPRKPEQPPNQTYHPWSPRTYPADAPCPCGWCRFVRWVKT